jgi:tetratricopeptide (TPR) repeat protein
VAAALGQYQEQAGLPREAAATYTKALAVQPTSRELKSRRIAALLAARDYTAAASFAGDAKRQHPEDARFPRLEARALFDAGDKVGGVSVLEAAAKTFPRDTPTLYALADIYRDAGRGTDAERRAAPGVGDRARQSERAELSRLPAGDARRQAGRGRAARAQGARGRTRQRRVSRQPGWACSSAAISSRPQKYLDAAANRMPHNSEVQDHLGDVFARARSQSTKRSRPGPRRSTAMPRT